MFKPMMASDQTFPQASDAWKLLCPPGSLLVNQCQFEDKQNYAA